MHQVRALAEQLREAQNLIAVKDRSGAWRTPAELADLHVSAGSPAQPETLCYASLQMHGQYAGLLQWLDRSHQQHVTFSARRCHSTVFKLPAFCPVLWHLALSPGGCAVY